MDLTKVSGPSIQVLDQYLTTTLVPVHVSHVRYNKNATTFNHLIDQADVVMVNDLAVSADYNFLGSIRQGGSLFVKTSLSKADLFNELSDQVKYYLVQKQVQLYTLDADLIARNYTIFYGKFEDYLSDIISAVFYKIALDTVESDLIIRALLERINRESENANIAYSKSEAIFSALCLLKSHGLCESIQIEGSLILELPVFVRAQIPSKVAFSAKSLEINTEIQLKSKSGANGLIPLMFPSAFKTFQKFRPDIPDAFSVVVSENIRLTPDSYDRNVFHMELDTTGTNLKYEIGDALGVYAQNSQSEVDSFISFFGVDPSQLVFVERTEEDGSMVSEIRTIEQLLIHTLDIFGKPGKKFYQYLAAKATCDAEKEAIASILEFPDEFDRYVEELTPTYADLLTRFQSAKLNVEELVRIIPSMKPRHYSIASSQRVHPNSVHLLVVVVEWTSKDNVQRFGQATRYLVNSKIGDRITVSVKPSVMKLPESLEAPVVMSGLGTGMAPFRAFIEERWYWKQQGKKVGEMILYFGSRNRANEYLYGEELDAYHSDGVLTHLRLAFSRDQKEKVYIQHKIQEDASILSDMLVKSDGAFYLCGPTWPVTDVTEALLTSFRSSMNIEESLEYLEDLKNKDRFVLEVY
jgi:sulfite reductase (NADPH) flavoprotein alpha-component